MPSTFNARDAEAYERVMGRWSRRLAGPFLDFARVDRGAVLDVGCGTGSLTFLLAERAPAIVSLSAIDVAPSYIAYAKANNRDPRVVFEDADAGSLPFPDASFDHCLSLLALHLMSEPGRAMGEMVRVTRPGGTIAGAVWDVRGGLPHARMFLDTAAMFDPAAVAVRDRYMTVPLAQTGELAALWRSHGLEDIEQTTVSVRFDFDVLRRLLGAVPDRGRHDGRLRRHARRGRNRATGHACESRLQVRRRGRAALLRRLRLALPRQASLSTRRETRAARHVDHPHQER